MNKDSYFRQYGVDTTCEIQDIFTDFDDNEKLNTLKMILDNLKLWWGDYIGNEQERIEYNKLKEIIEKLEELQKIRKDYMIFKCRLTA